MSRASPKIAVELDGWIERYQELKGAYQEYCQLGKLIKQAVRGRRRLVVGEYLVNGQWVIRKAHMVPETKYWQMRIERIARE